MSVVQCVAAIACAELPVNQWPEVIDGLVLHVTGEQAVEKLKEASLDAIGYICEDIVSPYRTSSAPGDMKSLPVHECGVTYLGHLVRTSSRIFTIVQTFRQLHISYTIQPTLSFNGGCIVAEKADFL